MSDDHTNRPPLDIRLPEELARCESTLADMSLPASQVSRDELLYRAGWVAAEEAAKSPVAPNNRSILPHGVSVRSTLAWSIASAAIAASLAVVVTLRHERATNSSVDLVAKADSVAEADPVADVDNIAKVAIAEDSDDGEPVKPMRSVHSVRHGLPLIAAIEWTAPLLIMRDRALLQQWDDPWDGLESPANGSFAGNDPSQAKTSREMLREFLPKPSATDVLSRDSVHDRIFWLWKGV